MPLPTIDQHPAGRRGEHLLDEVRHRGRRRIAESRHVDRLRDRDPDEEDRDQQQAERHDGAERGRAEHVERVLPRDFQPLLAPPAHLVEAERGEAGRSARSRPRAETAAAARSRRARSGRSRSRPSDRSGRGTPRGSASRGNRPRPRASASFRSANADLANFRWALAQTSRRRSHVNASSSSCTACVGQAAARRRGHPPCRSRRRDLLRIPVYPASRYRPFTISRRVQRTIRAAAAQATSEARENAIASSNCSRVNGLRRQQVAP